MLVPVAGTPCMPVLEYNKVMNNVDALRADVVWVHDRSPFWEIRLPELCTDSIVKISGRGNLVPEAGGVTENTLPLHAKSV